MQEYPYDANDGETHTICVNLISLQGSSMSGLTVGNKNSRQFVAKQCPMANAEDAIKTAMIDNQQKFIWVKAIAKRNGKNVEWFVKSSSEDIIARINLGKASCLANSA